MKGNHNKEAALISKEKTILDSLKDSILDPEAKALAQKVQWIHLDGLSKNKTQLFPIAILGKGSPLLLLHGFDSSFLEFRRIAPLLIKHHQLFIPDLFGFGFCPRPKSVEFNPEALLSHLDLILSFMPKNSSTGLIGASMGGAAALELARRNPSRINRLLLLAPAGVTGKNMPIPPPLNQLGVCFLRQPLVRKNLCKQAFANPDESVGEAEEQIASLHLCIPGWRRSLASFASSGGFANFGTPLPKQRTNVIWGKDDRILREKQRKESQKIFGELIEVVKDCGHLPHLDQPSLVAKRWLNKT